MNIYSRVATFHVVGWWAIAVPMNPNSALFGFIYHANPSEVLKAAGRRALNNQVAHFGVSASILKHAIIIAKVGGEVKNFIDFVAS